MTTELNELRLHSAISYGDSRVIVDAVIEEPIIAPFEDVVKAASLAKGITPEQLISKSRKREFVYSRFIVANYQLKYTLDVLEEVGRKICPEKPKDHCTIRHYREEFTKFVENYDPIIMTMLKQFNTKLLEINPNYKQL